MLNQRWTVVLTVSLDAETAKEIRQLATEHCCSVSAVVRWLLQDALARRREQKAKRPDGRKPRER